MTNNPLAGEWIEKGKSRYLDGRYTDAAYYFDQALKVAPEDPTVWNNKGLAISKCGLHKEAIACYDRALEINPKHIIAWCNRGFDFQTLGNHKEAIRCFNKALEIDPQFSTALNNKAFCENKLGISKKFINSNRSELSTQGTSTKPDGDKKTFISKENGNNPPPPVPEPDPANISSAYWNGKELFSKGKYANAIRYFIAALDSNFWHFPRESQGHVWYLKALCEDALGKIPDAIQSYSEFLLFRADKDDDLQRYADERINELVMVQAGDGKETERTGSDEPLTKAATTGKSAELPKPKTKFLKLMDEKGNISNVDVSNLPTGTYEHWIGRERSRKIVLKEDKASRTRVANRGKKGYIFRSIEAPEFPGKQILTTTPVQNQKGASENSSGQVMITRVAGVTYEGRQVVVRQLKVGEEILLIRDPQNFYDSNAIKVIRLNGQPIGFIPKEMAAELASQFDQCGHPVLATVESINGGYSYDSKLVVTIKFKCPR